MKDLACVVAMAGLAGHGVADVIHVPADYPTIQAGIDAAVDGDEVIVAPGTYFESVNFLGKAIAVRSADGPDPTIIDGTGSLHVVECATGEGADTVLDGFTITGGDAKGPCCGRDDRGGGMLNAGSSPTVTNCTFSGNSALYGGGMYNEAGSPTVTNCTFSGNQAASGGGGMYNDDLSCPAVTGCTFSGNLARSGGGMSNHLGSPAVSGCTFGGNQATSGGGMSNLFSSPAVIRCTFSGNFAWSYGGGMENVDSSPTVTSCTFSGNSAGGGGET